MAALDWARDHAHWPHHRSSRFVAAGGLRWHVQVLGEGDAPPLWLLHGTGASGHSWRDLLPLLQQRHTLVVPDLPGHGFSGRLPPSQQSLPGMAAALGDLAQALALPPAALLGHSAGAALAAQAVLDGRLPPALLIGVNAALLPFGGSASPLLGGLARFLSRRSLLPWLFAQRAHDPAAVRRMVAATGSQLDEHGLALYARLMRSPDHVAGALAMMGGWDLDALWPRLPRLPRPFTLLVGEADGTVPPAQARLVAAHCPGTRVVSRAGLGHLAHEEAPAWVADQVQQVWVAAQPLAAVQNVG